MIDAADMDSPLEPRPYFERKAQYRLPDTDLFGPGFWDRVSSSRCFGAFKGWLELPDSTASWINLIEADTDLYRARVRADAVRASDAPENLFELRRLTGFTWIRLAVMLNVDRRTLNNWVRGARIRVKNREYIAKTLAVMRFADRGSAERNAAALDERHVSCPVSPFEAIRARNYEVARQYLSHGPSRPHGRHATTDVMHWAGEFRPIVMHEDADGTEIVEPLPDEPAPLSRKRPIRRG